MKKLMLSVAVLAALASCSKMDEGSLDIVGGGTSTSTEKLTITVAVNGDEVDNQTSVSSAAANSRVAINNDWTLSWEDGDALLAVGKENYNTEKFSMTNYDAATSTFSGYVPADDTNFRLFYPYDSSAIADGNYSIDLTTQSAGATLTHMVSSDFVTDATDDISMQHIGAVAVLDLLFDDDANGDYAGYTFERAVVSGLKSKGGYSITAGTLSSTSSDITITADVDNPITIGAGGAATVRFNILPTTIEAGESIDVMLYLKSSSDSSIAAFSTSIDNTGIGAVDFDCATYNTLYVPTLSSADAISTLWTSYAADDFAGGTGVEGAPFKIETAAQLAKIADDVTSGETYSGKYFQLTADIDLSAHEWVAIGTNSYKFQGIFDGNSKSISGLYIDTESDSQGLFGYVSAATVKGVTVDGVVKGNCYVGGVVGRTSSGVSVTNCVNNATVIGLDIRVGGVVGSLYSSTSSITNCYNTGSVSGEGDYSVGGVVGYTSSSIINCYNTGSVSGSGYGVGGVAGYTTSSITNCYNMGSVSGEYIYVGGVVGRSSSSITNCYNMGSVSGDGGRDVGGVVGYTTSSVTNCYNTGSVSGSGYGVGGVAGYTDTSSVTNCCYNTGSVSGSSYVGGVVGYAYISSSVTNCYNTGSVSGSGDSVGGVVGQNDTSSTVNCYNTGSVSGSGDSVGGVVGFLYSSSSSVTNCYNTGSVSGSSYVGGVAGQNDGTVSYCYYNNEVYSGNLVGSGTAATNSEGMTTTQMQDADFVNNTLNYYVTTISGSSDLCNWLSVTDDYPTLNLGL